MGARVGAAPGAWRRKAPTGGVREPSLNPGTSEHGPRTAALGGAVHATPPERRAAHQGRVGVARAARGPATRERRPAAPPRAACMVPVALLLALGVLPRREAALEPRSADPHSIMRRYARLHTAAQQAGSTAEVPAVLRREVLADRVLGGSRVDVLRPQILRGGAPLSGPIQRSRSAAHLTRSRPPAAFADGPEQEHSTRCPRLPGAPSSLQFSDSVLAYGPVRTQPRLEGLAVLLTVHAADQAARASLSPAPSPSPPPSTPMTRVAGEQQATSGTPCLPSARARCHTRLGCDISACFALSRCRRCVTARRALSSACVRVRACARESSRAQHSASRRLTQVMRAPSLRCPPPRPTDEALEWMNAAGVGVASQRKAANGQRLDAIRGGGGTIPDLGIAPEVSYLVPEAIYILHTHTHTH